MPQRAPGAQGPLPMWIACNCLQDLPHFFWVCDSFIRLPEKEPSSSLCQTLRYLLATKAASFLTCGLDQISNKKQGRKGILENINSPGVPSNNEVPFSTLFFRRERAVEFHVLLVAGQVSVYPLDLHGVRWQTRVYTGPGCPPGRCPEDFSSCPSVPSPRLATGTFSTRGCLHCEGRVSTLGFL